MRGDLQKLLLGRIFMIDSSFPDSGFGIPGRVALNFVLLTSLLRETLVQHGQEPSSSV